MDGFDTSIVFHGDDADIGLRAAAFGKVRLSFRYILDSSGRRYRHVGTLRMLGRYIAAGYQAAFTKARDFRGGYEEVR
jgi:hypothetical protein